MNTIPPSKVSFLSFPRAIYRTCAVAVLVAVSFFCNHRAEAGWASQGQIPPITNFFDAGNDAFEVDAYPGIAAQGGWNTAWTLGFTAPQFISATTTSDTPLNGAGNYLNVTISNTTSSVSVRRQYTSYFNTGSGIGSSTNVNTFDVAYIPMRIRFDFRADGFTNSIYTNELSCVTNYITCTNDLSSCTTNTVYSPPPPDHTVTTNVVCTPTGNRNFAFGTNNWSSRNDNLFIHAANQNRTSPNTDSGWAIFVQGDSSRVQDPPGPANRWLYYDGSPIRNDQGAGKYVDSGMTFTFGTTYHFEIINDPRDKTYTVQVDNGTTTNRSGPLRWRAYGDVTAISARGFLTFGGTCNDTNAVLKFSTDSISVEHLPPSDFPPFVSQLKPHHRAPFVPKVAPEEVGGAGVPPLNFIPDYDTPEFWPAGRGISFVAQTAGGGSNDYSSGTYTLPGGLMATARTTIAPNGIGLVLNGADVTGGLTITTPYGPNFRKVTYNGLVPNTFYTGMISVTNSAGAVKQARLEFNTWDDAFVKVIEAEDYNYGDGSVNRAGGVSASTTGGLFLDNPTPSDWTNNAYLNQSAGYVDRVALANVDFSDTTVATGTTNNLYRFGDPVGTTLALDYRRGKYNTSGARDFQVSLVQPGEWLNYTRNFAAGTYSFYLRASSTATGGAGTNLVTLDYVTSDRTLPGQTTTNLGHFRVPYTGNAQAFTNTPLVASTGGPPITVTLPAGVHTLRLTAANAGNNLQLNYIVAVPGSGSGPSVAITSPTAGASFTNGANISLTASASVGTSQVEYFNGTTSLGSSSTGPDYLVTWNSVPTGKYSITAKATSSGGFSGKSAAVNITVGSPSKSVLFVRGGVNGTPGAVDASNLGGGDAVKKSIFSSLGWTVTDMWATNLNFLGGMACGAGFDMIAVSVSVQSGDINQNLRDVPVPLWNEEPSNMTGYSVGKDNPSSLIYGASGGRGVFSLRSDALGLAASAGYPAGIYQLTGLLAAGNRTSSLNENGIGILWSTNVSAGDSQSVFVWYYPAGAELFNGVIAPAVRYGWYNAVNEGQVSNPMNAIGTNFMVEGLKLTMSNPPFTGVLIYQYTPVITGTTVVVPFRAGSYEEATQFSLWSSTTIDGPYTNNTGAVITKPDPAWNLFEATTTTSGSKTFYRVRRN